MKTKLSVLFFALFISFGNAQTKVGTIDSELIIGLMPETKKVLDLLSRFANRIDSTYQIKVKEYQDKVKAFQDLKDVSDDYKKLKVEEIQNLEKGLQSNQDNGNKLIQLKRNELMRPLYKKVREAIEEVSKAENYTQILTSSGNEFAYIDEKFDITKKVMKKLGIKEPEKPKK